MKYTCTTCRCPFNTEPYVSNRQGIFCQRNCWEKHLDENGYDGARPTNGINYRGNHIKKH